MPSNTNIQPTIFAGSLTSISLSLLSPLPVGSQVIATVTYTSSDNRFVSFNSTVKTVDPIAPLIINVSLVAALGQFIQSTQTVQACWNASDLISGITAVEVALLTVNQSLSAAVWLPTGVQTCLVLGNLSLRNGQGVFAAVRATNGAGVQAVGASPVYVVDVSPPLVGLVRPSALFLSAGNVTVTVEGFQDPESGIAALTVCVGTAPGASNVRACTSTASVSSLQLLLTNLNVSLPSNSSIFITVTANNTLGLSSSIVSAPITLDLVPPLPTSVYDGVANSSATRLSGFTMSASWDAPRDVGSGIALCNLNFVDQTGQVLGSKFGVQNDLFAAVTVGALPSGSLVRAALTCLDFAGLATVSTSAGVLYDNSPSVNGTVSLGGTAAGLINALPAAYSAAALLFSPPSAPLPPWCSRPPHSPSPPAACGMERAG